MKHRLEIILTFALVATAALSAPLGAQSWDRKPTIPPGHRPPAGMCRIWIDGVPPGKQPAPTDCATAVRNRPSNGRVIFGSDKRVDWRDDCLNTKGKDSEKRRAECKARFDDRRGKPDDDDRGRRSRGSDDDGDRRSHGSDNDEDDDDDRGRRSRGSGDDHKGSRRSSDADRCVDANRDGRCDLIYRRVDGERSLPRIVRSVRP